MTEVKSNKLQHNNVLVDEVTSKPNCMRILQRVRYIVSIVFLVGFKHRNSLTRKGFQRLSEQNATLQFRQRNAGRTPKDEDEARRILIPTIRVGVREGYFGF